MRVGLFGRGRLGSAILACAQRQEGLEIAWSVDQGETPTGPVDAAIDASVAGAVEGHLTWALETGTPFVIGTTGWEIPDLASRVGNRTGVLTASNFSLTVALLARLATVAGRYAQLDPVRDPYVFEHHHRLKADAPSGTAKTLATAVMKGCPRKTEWLMPSLQGALQPHQLSVGVLRAGTEFGFHTVGIDTPSETLELSHRARSREPFAEGALAAARWLQGRTGLFTMEDLAASILNPLFDFGVTP
jgi:4-hydroxy-tetrahydrodipicolinate reductase